MLTVHRRKHRSQRPQIESTVVVRDKYQLTLAEVTCVSPYRVPAALMPVQECRVARMVWANSKDLP